MKVATHNGAIILAELNADQDKIVSSWGLCKWQRNYQAMVGQISEDLLEHLANICTLPAGLRAMLHNIKAHRARIELLRAEEDPQPIVHFPVTATMYKHQIRGANMAISALGICGTQLSHGFGFLMEMGTGKTLTAIAVVGAAYEARKVARLLVVAPTSVCSVWPDEIARFGNFPAEVALLLGSKKQRLAALSDLSKSAGCLQVAVINYESAWRDGIKDALLRWAPDMIIADESQRIKDHSTAQSKGLHALGDAAKYRLILSGTPVQNGAEDLWSQYRFLDPSVFGTSFYAFRGRYSVMGGYGNHKVVGYRKEDELIRKEYSIAMRVTKAEAIDLPEQTFERRAVLLEPSARTVYDALRRRSYAELDEGGQVTATTALTRILRLQQLTGGFLQLDDGGTQRISVAKLRALEDILDDYVIETGKKLVVFARFLDELDLIKGLLQSKGIGYGCIQGSVPMAERGGIVADFQENEATKVFLAQLDTAGLGITLTAADTCVYYSLSYNYASYSQSLARIHRIGQRNVCTYIHLVAAGTVDDAILKALSKKEDLAKTIVDNWREYLS